MDLQKNADDINFVLFELKYIMASPDCTIKISENRVHSLIFIEDYIIVGRYASQGNQWWSKEIKKKVPIEHYLFSFGGLANLEV